tara:strand:+ start:465 stop:1436 length:972 start_codon:yes stop_codon:yes gene_type:complete
MKQKWFSALSEDNLGETFTKHYERFKEGYRAWFLKEGEFNRPTFKACDKALKQHLPELYPQWEKICNIIDADDIDARLLSLYCPTPYVTGCSQAVWLKSMPILVRNYDYDLNLSEGVCLKTKWHGKTVIAMTDCIWGVLDGMNDDGLVVSLSFGGRGDVGKGFGIPIILRYILEFCSTVPEAIEVLSRVPTHMSYNVTLLDASGMYKTLEISPLSPPILLDIPIAVNHQGNFALTNYAIFSKSYERRQQLLNKLQDPLMNVDAFIGSFEYSPLFVSNYDGGFGTIYTAVYNPTWRAMELRWPHGIKMIQSFEHFEPMDVLVQY